MRRSLVAVLLVCLAVPTAAVAAGLSGTFVGKTAQKKHLKLVVKRGVIKRGSQIPYAMHCHHGRLGGTMEPLGPIRHGQYAVRLHNTESVGNGYKARHRSSLSITFSGHRARGKLTEHATVVTATGAVVDRCSASVTFTAHR